VGVVKQQEIDSKVNRPSAFENRPTGRPEGDNVKSTLDQIYDEYDVTLNDALNPTLKPITRSNPASFNRGYTRYEPAVYQSTHSTNRRSAILLQAPSRMQQHFSRYQGYIEPYVEY
jgi:hypothetical protein